MPFQVKILYDNRRINSRFRAAWGFSCLVGKDLLFDTGGNFKVLAKNAAAMKVELGKIRHVVLSHDHWDHADGLWGLLELNPDVHVYLCPGFRKNLAGRIRRSDAVPVIVRGWKRIGRNAFITAQMTGTFKSKPITERSLVLSSGRGLVIITGCAHAGPLKIVKTVKARFSKKRILALAGGLHLEDSNAAQIRDTINGLKALGVERLMACHCTGGKAFSVIPRLYGSKSRMIKAGAILGYN